MMAASSPNGLVITPEPPDEPEAHHTVPAASVAG